MLRIVLIALYLTYFLSSGGTSAERAGFEVIPAPVAPSAHGSPQETTNQGSGADPWG